MPDITMCMNYTCQSCDYCYRYTAVPNPHYQAYGDFRPMPGEDACDYFMSDTRKFSSPTVTAISSIPPLATLEALPLTTDHTRPAKMRGAAAPDRSLEE